MVIKGSNLLLAYLKNIIEKGFQDQTPGSMLIWILLLNKHSKKINYPTAEQRSNNRNILKSPQGPGNLCASGASNIYPPVFLPAILLARWRASPAD